MNIRVDFNSLESVINALATYNTNITEFYNEKVSITSYDGNKKDEIEKAINDYLLKASNNIAYTISKLMSELQRNYELYQKSNIDNKREIDSIGG